MTVYEYIEANPDSAVGDIARALGRTVPSVAGALSQLYTTGRIVKTGVTAGAATYRINDFPFGCSNALTLMFNQLLKEVRAA